MTARWPRFLFYLVGLTALLLDQGTKLWATAALRPVGMVPVAAPFFRLTYVENTGVAFGMFAGRGLLVALVMILLAVLAIYSARGVNWARRSPNIVGGMLLGGALGNIVDRLRQGYVTDFFDFSLGSYHWPVFNVADSLICLAVAWMVAEQLFPGKRGAD